MGRQKRRKATPRPATGRTGTIQPTPERMRHGDIVSTPKTLDTEAGHQKQHSLIIDAMLAGKLLDGPQHSAGESYHRLFVEAGRDTVKIASYSKESRGPSDRRDTAWDKSIAIDQRVKKEFGENMMRLVMDVCGRNVIPHGDKWRGPLAQALDFVGRG